MSVSDFVHLHVHSEYSVLDGACRVKDIVAKAKECGMPAVGLTDHGNMYGAIEFYLAAKEAGIAPIVGMESYVAPGSRLDKKASGISDASYHLTLLAKDLEGYKNLIQLSTIGHLEGFYYRPRLDKEVLRKYSKGLIALSGCLKGELASAIVEEKEDEARKILTDYQDIFGPENYYLELHAHGIADQKTVEKKLIEYSRTLGLKLAATNDFHYIQKTDAKSHDALLCIQTGTTMSDEKRFRFYNDEFYFKTPQEMKALFAEVPAAVTNTREIADRCKLEIPLKGRHLPKFSPPDGKSEKQYLRELCEQGVRRRYPEITQEVRDRMEFELRVIEQTHFESYFLVVWDFVRFAREKGIPVGPGRGSAAGCLVAYVLGITDIDPIRYHLIFERFLNPDRISMPDIDMDFCYDRRPEVIEYVSQKYGADNVAQIITFGTLGAKAVIRDVGRVLGMEYGEVDKIAKMVPNELNISLDKAVQTEPRLKEVQAADPRAARLFEHAFVLEGLVRNASTHAAGVVISEQPLTTYVPLCRGSNGEITTQYQMGDLEKIGLLKMDFLGLKTLTVINEAFKIIARTRGKKMTTDEIPLDDAKTFELLNKGQTIGVFQLESPGMQDLAKRIGIGHIEDIIALVALFRPGPMHMLDDFIARKKGKTQIKYDHPLLEPILKDTYGIMLYQEQVMKCANVIAGYSLAQADTLRRIMGKKIPAEMDKQKSIFIEGAAKNNIPNKIAEKIFETMAYFAGYGFNRSHSAAYGLISYHTAYLKAHYPEEYMAALLSSELNNTDKITKYIRELGDMGIRMLPPDINESYSTFTVVEKDIRFGLAAVKNVGKAAVEGIQAERMHSGRFKDFHDFLLRVESRLVNRKVLESLIKCGAFDFTKAHRFSLFTHLDDAMDWAAKHKRFTEENQASLFDMSSEAVAQKPSIQDMGEWPGHELLANEKELLGFYVTGHPLQKYRRMLSMQFPLDSSKLADQKDGAEVNTAGLISKARHTVTKKNNERMAILTMEDLAGSYEVLVFPQTYAKCRDLLEEDKAVAVKGRVSMKDEKPKIIASDVSLLENVQVKEPRALQVRVHSGNGMKTSLEGLRDLCLKSPGRCQVYVHLTLEDGQKVLLQADDALKIAPEEKVLEQIETLFGRDNVRVKA